MVPNIKNAGALNFPQYLAAFDDVVARARTGKLMPADFQGTTISLTNPGTVGTFGSVPRLMVGQGAIIATGAMDYPAEYARRPPETRAAARDQQGDDDHLHLRPPHHPGRGIGAVSRARCRHCSTAQTASTRRFSSELGMPYQPVSGRSRSAAAGCSGSGQPCCRVGDRSRKPRLRTDQRVSRARPSDRRSRSAGLDAGLCIRNSIPRHTASPCGTSTGAWSSRGQSSLLREVLEDLRADVLGQVGAEYMNIPVPEQKNWLQDRMEPTKNPVAARRADAAAHSGAADRGREFEQFLHTRFIGQKRFSLEGGEAGHRALEEIVERAAANGVQEIVIGMAHRGRLERAGQRRRQDDTSDLLRVRGGAGIDFER